MKNREFTYKPEILVEMAQTYLSAEDDYRQFVHRHTVRYTPSYSRLKLETSGEERDYWSKQKESSLTWDALRDACRLVGADMETVLATAKAMNRYEKRRRWQVCAHLPTGYSAATHYKDGGDRVRRFFSEADPDATCFSSTGRRKPWAA